MKLEDLLKEIKRLKKEVKKYDSGGAKYGLNKIKMTVRAVDKDIWKHCKKMGFSCDVWEEIKRELKC